MIVRRVHEQDNNANRYLVCLFQVVSRLKKNFKKNSQVVSRSTYKWYPTNGTHEERKCSRNGSCDKTNKWIDARRFFQVVSHFYMWYQSYKTVIPQVILNFKWSSSEASSLTYKSSSISNEWPMLWHRGGAPPIGIKVKRSYMRYLKGYKWCHSNICSGVHKKWRFKCQPSTPMQAFA